MDTCVFIWLCDEPELLTQRVRDICDDPDSELYLSISSIWEMQIKALLGKLELKASLVDAVTHSKNNNRLRILGIEESHVFGLKKLPSIHKDPFDRLLISQAKELNMALLTCDAKIAQYPVNVIW